jgi:hypothetical protein
MMMFGTNSPNPPRSVPPATFTAALMLLLSFEGTVAQTRHFGVCVLPHWDTYGGQQTATNRSFLFAVYEDLPGGSELHCAPWRSLCAARLHGFSESASLNYFALLLCRCAAPLSVKVHFMIEHNDATRAGRRDADNM